MTFDSTPSADLASATEHAPRRQLHPDDGWRAWTEAEIAILREHYPTGGRIRCGALLPHRGVVACGAKARLMGIRCRVGTTEGKRFARKYPVIEHLDNALREGWLSCKRRGDQARLAERLGRPVWWVQQRARQIGLVRDHSIRAADWSPEELQMLERWAACNTKVIAEKLRAAGFQRTESAVVIQIKRRHIDRSCLTLISAPDLAVTLGVHGKTIANWIERKGLPVSRDAVQIHGARMIPIAGLRKWVKENRSLIDLRRVDQPLFWDLILGAA